MAKNDELPSFGKKRDILFSERSSEERLRETGQKYLDAERYYDALEFFDRAEADDLVREVAEIALEAGDAPLYMRAKKVLGEKVTEQEWLALAEKAEEKGMLSAARLGYERAGREEKAASIEQRMLGAEREQPDIEPGDAG